MQVSTSAPPPSPTLPGQSSQETPAEAKSYHCRSKPLSCRSTTFQYLCMQCHRRHVSQDTKVCFQQEYCCMRPRLSPSKGWACCHTFQHLCMQCHKQQVSKVCSSSDSCCMYQGTGKIFHSYVHVMSEMTNQNIHKVSRSRKHSTWAGALAGCCTMCRQCPTVVAMGCCTAKCLCC